MRSLYIGFYSVEEGYLTLAIYFIESSYFTFFINKNRLFFILGEHFVYKVRG